MAGLVSWRGQPVRKAGQMLPPEAELAVTERPRFVGRGGEKLDGALSRLGIDAAGLVCLDAGASAGGFTDCLLQRGAASVFSVDVGYGQLDARLRGDARVISMERTDIRHVEALPVEPEFAVVDVSFIGLEKVLPAVVRIVRPGALVLALVKPQFQGERGEVGRGGIVRGPGTRAAIVGRLLARLKPLNLEVVGFLRSPITGGDGNQEFFLCMRTPTR